MGSGQITLVRTIGRKKRNALLTIYERSAITAKKIENEGRFYFFAQRQGIYINVGSNIYWTKGHPLNTCCK